MIYLEIKGRTPSKKTSQRIIRVKETGKPKLLPNPKYSEWESRAVLELKAQKTEKGLKKIDYPISLTALIYRQNKGKKPDLVNLLQSICDVLQKAEIIADDSIIVSLDGSRILPVDEAEDEGAEIFIFKFNGGENENKF
jgi:Holliday junction resolvase RusA-like endonuclease